MAALTVTGAGGGRVLVAERLTASAFRPYGDVVELNGSGPGYAINGSTAWRLHDQARVEADRGGHVAISVVRAQPRPLPFRLQCVERHVRGSQAFVPRHAGRWLVVVCSGDSRPDLESLRAFVASAAQGVNYARGTWHHPLLAIDRVAEFVVVDRVADDAIEDCETRDLADLEVSIDADRIAPLGNDAES